jgi:hypothetical protein
MIPTTSTSLASTQPGCLGTSAKVETQPAQRTVATSKPLTSETPLRFTAAA